MFAGCALDILSLPVNSIYPILDEALGRENTMVKAPNLYSYPLPILPSLSGQERKQLLKLFDKIIKDFKKSLELPAKSNGLFNVIDVNNNSLVSLEELDHWLLTSYPHVNSKPAMLRTLAAMTGRSGQFIYSVSGAIQTSVGDLWVARHEFREFMCYLLHFNKIYVCLSINDSADGLHLSCDEFKAMLTTLDFKISASKAETAFGLMASTKSERKDIVSFDTICLWYSQMCSPNILGTPIGEELSDGTKKSKESKKYRKRASNALKCLKGLESNIKSLLDSQNSVAELIWAAAGKPLDEALIAVDFFSFLISQVGSLAGKQLLGNNVLQSRAFHRTTWRTYEDENAFVTAVEARSMLAIFFALHLVYQGTGILPDSSVFPRLSTTTSVTVAAKLQVVIDVNFVQNELTALNSYQAPNKSILLDDFAVWIAGKKFKDAVKVPALHSKFIDAEKEILSLADSTKAMHSLYTEIDKDGSGMVDLKEIDRFVRKRFPVLNSKLALLNVYKRITEKTADLVFDSDGVVVDQHSQAFIERPLFRRFLVLLLYFNKIYDIHGVVGMENSAEWVSMKDFRGLIKAVGLQISLELADSEFTAMCRKYQKESGVTGFIQFDDVCEWVARKFLPKNNIQPFGISQECTIAEQVSSNRLTIMQTMESSNLSTIKPIDRVRKFCKLRTEIHSLVRDQQRLKTFWDRAGMFIPKIIL